VARHVSATQLQAVIPEKLPRHVDPHCTEGLDETRYAIADVHAIQNTRLEFHMPEIGIPTSVLRTTGYGPAIFALESFIDELAQAAGADPYQYRRALLLQDRRALAVLDLAADKAGWGRPLMAQVVELSLEQGKTIRLRRIVTVADPGTVFDSGIALRERPCRRSQFRHVRGRPSLGDAGDRYLPDRRWRRRDRRHRRARAGLHSTGTLQCPVRRRWRTRSFPAGGARRLQDGQSGVRSLP
jgi:hypothetical protein